jgi:branched-chain amino acid transport system substrate-binding protein
MGLLIVIGWIFSRGCLQKKPIFIGFAAQLTGKQAELGVQERNGAQLAVEDVNAVKGVAGRPIELVVQDDLGTPEGAQTANRKLIKTGVLAIVGHATSGQTLAGLQVTDPARVLMLSPTTSTPALNGRDDYFFRVIRTFVDRAQAFARYVYQGRRVTRLAFLYDTDNAAYSKAYLETFRKEYTVLGGKVVSAAGFSSTAQPDFAPLISQLRASKAEGIFLITADYDTALIAQRTRLLGWKVPLFSSGWAQTEILIKNGGQAVEGMELEQAYDMNSQTPALQEFKKRYQTRFGHPPSFGAALGYEAVRVLAAALQKTGGQAEGVKQALLEIRKFEFLADTFSFDKFGDVVRPYYFCIIREGKFATLKSLK